MRPRPVQNVSAPGGFSPNVYAACTFCTNSTARSVTCDRMYSVVCSISFCVLTACTGSSISKPGDLGLEATPAVCFSRGRTFRRAACAWTLISHPAQEPSKTPAACQPRTCPPGYSSAMIRAAAAFSNAATATGFVGVFVFMTGSAFRCGPVRVGDPPRDQVKCLSGRGDVVVQREIGPDGSLR
jgi:hypothetical protein